MRKEIKLSSAEIMEAVDVVKNILESGYTAKISVNRKNNELMIFSEDAKMKYREAITAR